MTLSIPVANAFLFCPRCSAASCNPGSNPFRCASCEFVFYFSPTAAVGGLLTNPDGELLFLVRGKDPGRGLLGLPGGFADPGETLEQSLVREVFEETSLRVTRARYLCSFPNRYRYRGNTVDVLDTFFVCQVESLDELARQSEEVAACRFAHPDAETLARIAFPSNRLAIEFFITHHQPGMSAD